MSRESREREGLNYRVYFLLVISLLLVFFSIYLLLNRPQLIEVKEFDVKFIIGENPGFDLNNSLLIFGRVPRGGTATRPIVIENGHDFPVNVRMSVSEEIRKYVVVNETFFLDSGQKENLFVVLSVPRNEPYGNYSGKLRILFYRVE